MEKKGLGSLLKEDFEILEQLIQFTIYNKFIEY